ncbi:M23 family metallopeptidase [Couchioplanes caeruleus]|uniref:M23ase beta-sheet core domain-containing protein n=1 Tax=Couchioplanes caeruleus subsp. caeruleus TaxID=56427 RepID=A0A1K0GUQ0_9ACTN|nr:M23 family metallopeptidase [Couchioplanes caeruleus]OJF15076.1 hypothetical protein BG844_06380 [Couchioplanes caeruleus subsp. caeruleus]
MPAPHRTVPSSPPEDPFPCGQQWTASTRSDHIPNPHSLDLLKVGGGSNNQPILAVAGGRVVKSAYDGGGGWHVRIDHGNGWQTRYLHMISAPAVSVDQTVVQGQLIGRVGSTGDSGTPHLHFEQMQDGTTVRSAFDGQLVTVEVGRSQGDQQPRRHQARLERLPPADVGQQPARGHPERRLRQRRGAAAGG